VQHQLEVRFTYECLSHIAWVSLFSEEKKPILYPIKLVALMVTDSAFSTSTSFSNADRGSGPHHQLSASYSRSKRGSAGYVSADCRSPLRDSIKCTTRAFGRNLPTQDVFLHYCTARIVCLHIFLIQICSLLTQDLSYPNRIQSPFREITSLISQVTWDGQSRFSIKFENLIKRSVAPRPSDKESALPLREEVWMTSNLSRLRSSRPRLNP